MEITEGVCSQAKYAYNEHCSFIYNLLNDFFSTIPNLKKVENKQNDLPF